MVFGDSRCCFLLQILSEPRILCRPEGKLAFQVQFKTHDLKFELNDKFCKDNRVHVVREEVEEPPVPLRKRKDQQDHWRNFLQTTEEMMAPKKVFTIWNCCVALWRAAAATCLNDNTN